MNTPLALQLLVIIVYRGATQYHVQKIIEPMGGDQDKLLVAS